jgi:hypothetical protein
MKTGFVTLLFLAFSQVTNLYSFLTHIFHHSIDTLYLSLALTKHPSISDLGRPEATLHDGSIGNGNPYGRFCPFNIRLSLCPHIPSQVGRSDHHLIPSYMNVLYSIIYGSLHVDGTLYVQCMIDECMFYYILNEHVCM